MREALRMTPVNWAFPELGNIMWILKTHVRHVNVWYPDEKQEETSRR